MKTLALIITLFFACGVDEPIEKHIEKKLPDRICEPYKSVEGFCEVVQTMDDHFYFKCTSDYLCYLCDDDYIYCDANTD